MLVIVTAVIVVVPGVVMIVMGMIVLFGPGKERKHQEKRDQEAGTHDS